MVAWFEDLEVTARLLMGNPPSLESEHDWIRKVEADPNSVIWAIEHEGRVVGTTAIHDISWRRLCGTSGTVLGDKSLWGKGIGSEAMRLRTRYAFTELPLRKLKSAYLEGNEASWRAQQKVGYREVGRFREDIFKEGRWLDEVVTEVLRTDWEKATGG